MRKIKIHKQLLLTLVLSVSGFNLMAQTEEHPVSEEHEKGFHSITLVMANAFLPNSFDETTDDILLVPVYGLNYDYQFNSHWGTGLHADILFQQFKVEKHGSHEELTRENPIALVAILFYKPNHRWKILAGYGLEFEKNDNLQVIRAGAEYGIPLPKDWELGLSLEFDIKLNYYANLVLGIGFTKRFGSNTTLSL